MAGYHFFSMSNNAVTAYRRGLLPASRAAKEFGFKSTRDFRACVVPGEWHHTSKHYNATDFFDVGQSIDDAEWRELLGWRKHMTGAGWLAVRGAIAAKMREQINAEPRPNKHHKYRCERLAELANKYPTPYQRHNGLAAIESALSGKLLSERNYLAVKKEVDDRRSVKQTNQQTDKL